MKTFSPKDNTAAFAEAFFIGNLVFVGIFYIALWTLYVFQYKTTSDIGKKHLRQALIASSLSTIIFLSINVFILLTDGYHSLTAFFGLEFYYMLMVPLFLAAGIMAFSKAIKGLDFNYPLIRQLS